MIDFSDLLIRAAGPVAVVTGKSTVVETYKGEDRSGDQRFTQPVAPRADHRARSAANTLMQVAPQERKGRQKARPKARTEREPERERQGTAVDTNLIEARHAVRRESREDIDTGEGKQAA